MGSVGFDGVIHLTVSSVLEQGRGRCASQSSWWGMSTTNGMRQNRRCVYVACDLFLVAVCVAWPFTPGV